MVDISELEGTFKSQQLAALAVLVVLLLLIIAGLNARKRNDQTATRSAWQSLVGLDNRASTSRTVAFVWTLLVGYCLLTLVLIANLAPTAASPVPPGSIPVGWIEAAFQPLSQTILIQLGIPLGSAIAAKLIVSQKIKSGTQQKAVSNERASVGQLVTDDDGNVDLVDLQYVLFSLIAALFVLLQFIEHPSRGIGIVPEVFVTLTGASAAIFVGNKMLQNNQAKVDPLIATTAAPGSSVLLTGSNLIVGDSGRSGSQANITLSPVDSDLPAPPPIPTDEGSDASRVSFKIPSWLPPDSLWKVTLTTNAGSPVSCPSSLRIMPGPTEKGAGYPHSGWVKVSR